MKKTKKILCIAFAALFCLCTFSGCGDKRSAASDWEYVKENGNLVIGITNYKPMNYYDDSGTLIGFDTEYAEAVCKKLGITPKFIEIDWDNKETELDAFNVDCLWNGVTYTPARAENMDFTKSYIHNSVVVVIRSADAAKYTDTASLVYARLVSEVGATSEDAISDDANLSMADFTPSESLVSSLMEVSAGTADAAAVDSTMADDLVGHGAYADLMIIDGLILADETLAIGFRTGSNLVEKVNAVTDEFLADGTLQALAEKYQVNLITD